MKKNILLLAILTTILFFNSSKVFADISGEGVYIDRMGYKEGTRDFIEGGENTYLLYSNGTSKEMFKVGPHSDTDDLWHNYHYSKLGVKINGKIYPAFCIDPNKILNTGTKMTCKHIDDPGVDYIIKKYNYSGGKVKTFTDSGFDLHGYAVVSLATRLYGNYLSQYSLDNSSNETKFAFHQIMVQYMNTNSLSSSKYMTTTGALGYNDLTEAAKIAKEGINIFKEWSDPTDGEEEDWNNYIRNIKIVRTNVDLGDDPVVTYVISGDGKVTTDKITVTCDSNCHIKSLENLSDGTVLLKIDKFLVENGYIKGYHASVKYSLNGNYLCDSGNTTVQRLFVHLDGQEYAEIICEGSICSPPDEDECDGTIPGISGGVHNCCEDNAKSTAKETELDNLFCINEELRVRAKAKTGAQEYLMDKEKVGLGKDNEYCEMYCTERVEIEIPGAITAVSGRYFKLTQTSKGTTSPYVEGYNRCRIVVNYKKWYEAYKVKFGALKDAFNKYQEAAALYASFEDATKSTGSTTKTCTKGGCTVTETETCTEDVTVSTTTYRRPTKKYGRIKINKNDYGEFSFAKDTEGEIRAATYTEYSSPSGYSCSSGDNFIGSKNNARRAMENAENAYKSAVEETNKLEKYINDCTNLFDIQSKLSSEELKEIYSFEPEMKFYYTQVYKDTNGNTAKKQENVKFKTEPVCSYSLSLYDRADAKDGLAGIVRTPKSLTSEIGRNLSSNNYIEKLKTINKKEISYITSSADYTRFIEGSDREIDKLVYHDGRYDVKCYWEEEKNYVATLVPTGSTVEVDKDTYVRNTIENGILHKRVYKIYLTTYKGDYLTNWKLTHLGSREQFDEYVKKKTPNCAGNLNKDEEVLTCKIKVSQELVEYGECNNPNGFNVVEENIENEEVCEKNGNPELFSFKVVDPANIFPEGTVDERGVSYAYNWTDTDEGKKAKRDIENLGATSSTYSPDTLTYSFELTPKDMKAIKKYNAQQKNNGGYTDFNLKCVCPFQGNDNMKSDDDIEDDGTTSDIKSTGCVKCESTFLTNLAAGTIKYKDGSVYNLSGRWNNPNKTIVQIRGTW